MLPTLLLAAAAHASTDIGSENKFGIGAEFGTGTYVNVTGKFYFDDSMGISFRAGTSFSYHEIGGSFESDFYRGTWFDWADLPIFWYAGIDVGMYTLYGVYPEVGVGGGVGAALQFSDFPLEVFTTQGADFYPLNWCSAYYGAFNFGYGCGFGWRATVGARYYF